MTRTKLFLPLFVILVMGMATSAFAQITCNVASTPVSRAITTGHTEQAGDIIFNCSSGPTPTTLATVTISYPATITNSTAYPTGRPIAVPGPSATGIFAGALAPTVSAVVNTTPSGGQVVISVPANPAGAGLTGSFSLVGVLLSLNGLGLPTGASLSANVSVSPGNGVLITAGQNNATVITSILPGINTTTAPPALVTGTLPALYFASSATAVPGRGTFAFTVTENFIDAFRDNLQITGSINDTQLLVTLSGMPTGTSLTGCSAALSGAATTVTVNGVAVATIAAATPTMTLDWVGATNLTAIETVTVTCTGFTAPASALPLSATITGTVTLSPIGAALAAGTNAVLTAATTGQIPRYQSTTSSLGTLLSFTPSTTTMIIPYATGDPSLTAAAGTFDTGIAIANTTADTVGGTSIFTTGGAVAQAGTITFTFFPSDGVAANRFSVTTATINSGATYIALVSEILRAGGRTTSFTGYIIAVANFTNGHGTAFVFGGNAANSRITSATDLLVIPSPVAAARTLAGGIGALVEQSSK